MHDIYTVMHCVPAIVKHMFYCFRLSRHIQLTRCILQHLSLSLSLSLSLYVYVHTRNRDDTGVFVSELRRGGVAKADGRLMVGDQILSINGEDVRTVTEDYANSLLQVALLRLTTICTVAAPNICG